MGFLQDAFGAPKNVNVPFDKLYAPIISELQKNPEILKNFLQYSLPQLSRMTQEHVADINATVKDPRLEAITRLKSFQKLAGTMSGSLGEAIQGQEQADWTRRMKLADVNLQKGSDEANLEMFNVGRKDAYTSAMTGLLGDVLGASATFASGAFGAGGIFNK